MFRLYPAIFCVFMGILDSKQGCFSPVFYQVIEHGENFERSVLQIHGVK